MTQLAIIAGSLLMACYSLAIGDWMAFAWASVSIGLVVRLASAPRATSEPVARAEPPPLFVAAPVHDADLLAEVQRLRATETELVAARQLAESAALAKGEFLATISHEVRTPLNGIIPILDLLLGAPLPDDLRDHVRAAFASSKELLRIVNDVLDYSKLEAGHMQLENASFRPAELVTSVAALMRRSADTKNLRIEVNLHDQVPVSARGDALRLRQVLTNLLSNAIKFTERGGVAVHVTKVGEDRTHRLLRFAVSDTGIGVREAALDRLFQPFSQADASTSRTHGGTGLGLVICHRIVAAMGGRIGAESTFGRGSTFWFEVPVMRGVGESNAHSQIVAHALLLTRDEALGAAWSAVLGAACVKITRVATVYEANALLQGVVDVDCFGSAPEFIVVDLATTSKTIGAMLRLLQTAPALAKVKLLFTGDSEGLVPADLAGRSSSVPRTLNDAQIALALRGVMRDATGKAASAAPEIMINTDYGDDFAGLRVLLVDDIPINRYAGQKTLERLGLVVTLAEGGRAALDLMAEQSFDIVLMDCQMPDVDGFTVTRAHRVRERRFKLKRLPVIAVTANAMRGDRERCLEAGMDDHIPKPIERAALLPALAKWLPRRSVAAGTAGETRAAETA
jgi:signal transduction histidine kinase/ActR/RegA family two-component response regulator